MKHGIFLTIASLGLAFPAQAADLPGKSGVTVSAGTLGIGVEFAHTLPVANLTGRVAWNGFNYDYDDSIDGIDYELGLELSSVTALVDWRPWGKAMHLTAGVVFNGNEIGATSAAAQSYEIGGQTFTADQVGTLRGNVSFDDDVVPYFGLGWNIPVAPKTALSLEMGVVFQGSPKLSLSADGALADDPLFQAELAAEEAEFQDDISNLEYYPVIALGVQRRF